jgi:hypothetical protein
MKTFFLLIFSFLVFSKSYATTLEDFLRSNDPIRKAIAATSRIDEVKIQIQTAREYYKIISIEIEKGSATVKAHEIGGIADATSALTLLASIKSLITDTAKEIETAKILNLSSSGSDFDVANSIFYLCQKLGSERRHRDIYNTHEAYEQRRARATRKDIFNIGKNNFFKSIKSRKLHFHWKNIIKHVNYSYTDPLSALDQIILENADAYGFTNLEYFLPYLYAQIAQTSRGLKYRKFRKTDVTLEGLLGGSKALATEATLTGLNIQPQRTQTLTIESRPEIKEEEENEFWYGGS